MITLYNLNTITEGVKNIVIKNGKIEHISSLEKDSSRGDSINIHFDNAIVFPGLINSHDHLEFNLFTQLGERVYRNYLEWSTDIHKKNKDEINDVLQIPKGLRIQWSIYKNLIAGITTVVNHGERLYIKESPIDIFQRCYPLHSTGLEKQWKQKLNNPFAKKFPFVIHTGEGTDVTAAKEIDQLIKWNLFKRKIIGVHGVAMNRQQAKAFEALIWCPDSNFFLLNATAKVNELKKSTKIIFGTDSTLSAGWNVWEHLRLARNTSMLTDIELFNSLTNIPASVWNLNAGSLAENKNADIVVAKIKGSGNALNNFFTLNPEDILLILKEGTAIYFDETLFGQLSKYKICNNFSRIFVKGVCKFVQGDLPGLIKQIKNYNKEIKFPAEVN